MRTSRRAPRCWAPSPCASTFAARRAAPARRCGSQTPCPPPSEPPSPSRNMGTLHERCIIQPRVTSHCRATPRALAQAKTTMSLAAIISWTCFSAIPRLSVPVSERTLNKNRDSQCSPQAGPLGHGLGAANPMFTPLRAPRRTLCRPTGHASGATSLMCQRAAVLTSCRPRPNPCRPTGRVSGEKRPMCALMRQRAAVLNGCKPLLMSRRPSVKPRRS